MYPGQIVTQVNKYLAALNAHDLSLMERLYDVNATIEDPAGSETRQGLEAIKALYEQAFTLQVDSRLAGDIRIASNFAAFPTTVFLKSSKSAFKIEVIDICEFNDEGKIISRQSYWGPDNLSKI